MNVWPEFLANPQRISVKQRESFLHWIMLYTECLFKNLEERN